MTTDSSPTLPPSRMLAHCIWRVLYCADVDLLMQVLEESDTSSEISCRKDALNLENGDFKTSIEKAITKLPRIQHLVREKLTNMHI